MRKRLIRVARKTSKQLVNLMVATVMALSSLALAAPLFFNSPALAATANIDHLAFTTAAQSVSTNTPSDVITVTTENSSNASEALDTSSNPLTVASSSTTGEFAAYSSGACSTFSTGNFTATMASGTANKNFCYEDSTAGTYTLTATLSNGSNPSQTWTATQGITATNSVDISTAAQLRSAIEHQANNQVWTIESGNYAVTATTDITESGQTGWYFPITASNLTINGVGNPTIYGSGYTANGAFATQDLIAIFGSNVTINGVTLMPKVEPNKTIEVLGNNVTIENTTIKPNTLVDQSEYSNLSDSTEQYWGGSIYYNGAGGTQTLNNVTIDNGGVSYHAAAAGVSLVFTNVNLDYTTNVDWINSYRYSSSFDNPTGSTLSGTPTVTYYVNQTLNNLSSAVSNAQTGDTVIVASGDYSGDGTISVSKGITLKGAQSGVAAASTSSGTQRSGGESILSRLYITSSNVTVDGFSFNNSGTNGQLQVLSSGATLAGITVENNIFSGYSNVALPTNGAGNITIKQNYFTNPSASAEAMQIKTLGNAGDCSGTQVLDNVFTAATTNGAADVNLSCTSSNSTNITVSGNRSTGNTNGSSFTALAGVSDGINLSNNTATTNGSAIFFWGGVTGSASITGNTITGGSSNAVSIQDMGASYGTNSGTFTIENNDLSGNSFGVKVGTGALSGSGTVNAAQNYWGSGVDPSTLVSSGVTYKPYYLDSSKSILSTGDSLTSLSLSSGTLSPTFSSGTTTYTASVPNSVSSVTPTYASSTGSSVTLSSNWSNLAVGSNNATLSVKSADGTASQTYTVTITRAAATQTVPNSSGNATATSSQPQVVVTSTSTPITVTVSSGTNNASIDYSSLKTSSTQAVVPQTTINTQNANVQIQSGTTITASSSSWDGVVNAPTVQTATSVSIPTPTGQSTIVGTVINVGASDDISLTFDKAVRLLIPGQAGQLVGFIRGGNFTQITTVCSADSQAAGNALPAGGDCYINVGADMAVWTKHFTQFVTYVKSNTYVVQPGDTMFSISLKLGVSLAQLEALNPQAGHPAGNFALILPGDVLNTGSAVVQTSSAITSGQGGNGGGAGSVKGQSTNANSGKTSSAKTKIPTASLNHPKTSGLHWYWWVVIAVAAFTLAGLAAYRYAEGTDKAS